MFAGAMPWGLSVEDILCDCCVDVIAARNCVPRLSFLTMRVMPPDLTFKQLQWDLETLEKAEAAFEIESVQRVRFHTDSARREHQPGTGACRTNRLEHLFRLWPDKLSHTPHPAHAAVTD